MSEAFILWLPRLQVYMHVHVHVHNTHNNTYYNISPLSLSTSIYILYKYVPGLLANSSRMTWQYFYRSQLICRNEHKAIKESIPLLFIYEHNLFLAAILLVICVHSPTTFPHSLKMHFSHSAHNCTFPHSFLTQLQVQIPIYDVLFSIQGPFMMSSLTPSSCHYMSGWSIAIFRPYAVPTLKSNSLTTHLQFRISR